MEMLCYRRAQTRKYIYGCDQCNYKESRIEHKRRLYHDIQFNSKNSPTEAAMEMYRIKIEKWPTSGVSVGHLGTGTRMAQPIPKVWEREWE